MSRLVFSSIFGLEDTVSSILDNGVDVRNEDCSTSLLEACERGHWKVVKTLAEHGVDVNVNTLDGDTALTLACKKGHGKVVETLIEHKSNINERDIRGMTALMVACEHGHLKVVEILIERKSDLNEKDLRGRTALTWACQVGSEEVFKLLIKNGADLEARDFKGVTPLIVACKRNNIRIVELLTDQIIDVNASDNYGTTPLMEVCNIENRHQDDSVEMIRFLYKHGVDVDTQEITYGRSAVMIAVLSDNVKCLQVLLSAGPNLDSVDRDGRTVFSHAMENKTTDCLKVLLEDGKLLTDGRLKQAHKNRNIEYFSKESLLVTIQFGVFEWEWCPLCHLKPVTLAASKSGISPGKIKYECNTYLSPLVVSLLDIDTEWTEILLERLYYYLEDYRTLCMDMDIRGRIKNTDILDKITLQPLSLQTWCYLNVCEAISTSCVLVKRCELVNALPIPDCCKTKLNFE